MERLSEAARAAVERSLQPGERIDMVAPAVGSGLVLTDRRLLVVRDGASYRPSTGVRSFELDSDLEVRIGPARKRVIIRASGSTINLFVRSEQLAQAETLLAEVRRRIYLR
jgi:hypothetical protein